MVLLLVLESQSEGPAGRQNSFLGRVIQIHYWKPHSTYTHCAYIHNFDLNVLKSGPTMYLCISYNKYMTYSCFNVLDQSSVEFIAGNSTHSHNTHIVLACCRVCIIELHSLISHNAIRVVQSILRRSQS